MAHLDFIDPGNSGGSVPAPESPWVGIQPKPITYRCKVCGELFENPDALFDHRFAQHPFKRPALFLAGHEITTPRQLITRQLHQKAISVLNADTCLFDGQGVDIAKLPEHLAKLKGGLHELVLAKHGIETRYEFDFVIADERDINEVDKLFFALAGGEVLDVAAINTFINMASQFASANHYIDGLCQYLYGVLAKDQRGNTHLDQSTFKTKFNLALDALRLFDTDLARVIVGVVNFNENAFNRGEGLSAAPKLQSAMQRFHGFLKGEAETIGAVGSVSDKQQGVPLDHGTDQIIRWALMSADELHEEGKLLERHLQDPSWPSDDRFKIRMLLAEMYTAHGDTANARSHARFAVNDALFGEWAQRILDMGSKR